MRLVHGHSREFTFDDWLEYGAMKGWCSEPVCAQHDCLPMTKEEEDRYEEGFDPCLVALRLWNDQ